MINSPVTDLDFQQMTECHKMCLPHTAGALVGPATLNKMYRVLNESPDAIVLCGYGRHDEVLAFASAAFSLSRAEKCLNSNLNIFEKVRFAYCSLPDVRPLLAKFFWPREIYLEGSGYILTIGINKSSPNFDAHCDGLSGQLMLHALLQKLKEAGCQRVYVDTEARNQKAREFYLRNGFSEVKNALGQILLWLIIQ